MTTWYKIQAMDERNYNEYMNGGHHYTVETFVTKNLDRTVTNLEKMGYKVNKNFIRKFEKEG